jgi:hypothetical protein
MSRIFLASLPTSRSSQPSRYSQKVWNEGERVAYLSG